MKDLGEFDVQVLIPVCQMLCSKAISLGTHDHQRKLRIYQMDSVGDGDRLRELLIPPVICLNKGVSEHITTTHLAMPVINFTFLLTRLIKFIPFG